MCGSVLTHHLYDFLEWLCGSHAVPINPAFLGSVTRSRGGREIPFTKLNNHFHPAELRQILWESLTYTIDAKLTEPAHRPPAVPNTGKQSELSYCSSSCCSSNFNIAAGPWTKPALSGLKGTRHLSSWKSLEKPNQRILLVGRDP